jgi:hypothetical protein
LVVAKDQIIPEQCEGIVMARLQSQLGVVNEVVETSLQAPMPEGICIARSLVQHRQGMTVSVLNATHHEQKLTRRSPLAQCEPVTLVTQTDLERQLDQESSSKLQNVTEGGRTHLSNGEFREIEELLAEYKDTFAVDNEDHGRTKKLYHRIDT